MTGYIKETDKIPSCLVKVGHLYEEFVNQLDKDTDHSEFKFIPISDIRGRLLQLESDIWIVTKGSCTRATKE
jgi:hypothetical protein